MVIEILSMISLRIIVKITQARYSRAFHIGYADVTQFSAMTRKPHAGRPAKTFQQPTTNFTEPRRELAIYYLPHLFYVALARRIAGVDPKLVNYAGHLALTRFVVKAVGCTSLFLY